MSPGEIAIAAAAGVASGVLAGVLGTGGGFFTVPVMVLLLGRGQTVAQGTSLVAIIATAAMGTYGNSRRRDMPWPLITRIAAGGIVGAAVGASLALHVLGDEALRRVFGVLLILTALRVALPRRKGTP